MEIQAAAQMESKEILTLPRIVPMQRTVAIPLSPVTSKTEANTEDFASSPCGSQFEIVHSSSSKSIQVKLPVQVKTSACTVILDSNTYKSNKRSRSEEELSIKKRTLKKEILKLMQDLNNNSYCDMDFNEIDTKHQNVRHRCEFDHLSNNCRNLRRSMSDSVGCLNDFCVDQNRQKTHEYINDTLNVIKTSDIRKSDVYRDQLLPEFINNLKYLGPIDKPKVNNESYVCQNDYCDNNDSGASRRSHKNTNSSYLSNDSNFRQDLTSLVNNNIPQVSSQAELRNLIDLDILAFTQKYQLNITTASLHDLREELFLLFVMNLANNSFVLKNYMKKNVKNTLRNRGFTESQAIYLTDILIEHFQEEFSTNNSVKLNSPNIGSDTFIALSNVTKNPAIYLLSSRNIKNESDSSLNEISQKDINANVDVYVNQISHELEEWLSNLQIPATQDNVLRQTIIHNLANDIVDRKKYLELNPSSELSDVSELENLKYQIFKWVYKMVDSADISPLENACDLMNRIENIPVPVFTAYRKKIDAHIHEPKVVEDLNLRTTSTRRLNSPANICCKGSNCDNNITKDRFENTSKRNYSLQESQPKQPAIVNTRRRSSPGGYYLKNTERNKVIDAPQPTGSSPDFRKARRNALNLNGKSTDTVDVPNYAGFSGGIQIRDDNDKNTQHSLPSHQINGSKLLKSSEIVTIDQQYPEYLKEWVDKIPIPAVNDEEKMLVKKVRVKVCDDLHQIVSKLKAESEILNNRFLCEDILDDEIEKILSRLPQEPELKSRKHVLKVQLIEKIVENIELYKSSLIPSHNQKPIDIVKDSLPNAVVDESQNADVLQLYEKLQILNLVEDFIASSHFQNEDQIMIEAYRNKLVKCTRAFIDELKARHNKALKNIETKSYLEDIMITLQNVPMPSEKSVQEEADEILLGIEIDKWFIELPLIESDEFIEQLNRRRLRNSLVKQICGVEKSMDNTDPLKVKLEHEISQFLEKAPLQVEKNLNINAMVENLIKRLECRPRSIETDMKKVEFSRIDYGEFSRNMPCCSSYTEYRNPHEGVDEVQNTQIGAHSHKSVQVVRQAERVFGDLDSICCKSKASLEEPPYHETLDNARSVSSSRRDDVTPHWYTLQESRQECPQRNNTQNSNTRFCPHYLSNASTSSNYREHQPTGVKQHSKCNRFEGEFLTPERHSNQDNSGFTQNRKPQSVHNQRSPPRKFNANRSPLSSGNQEANREMSSHTVDQHFSTLHSPVMSSQRRESLTLNRGNLASEHATPYRTPHRLSSQDKFERYDYMPKRSPELQNIDENQHSTEINQSHVFDKTDQDKVNQSIGRNRKTNRTITMECHPPNVVPPGIKIKLNSNKGYVNASDIEGKYQGEDSEEDTEGSDIRCKCMERMWRRKRPRYCPFDEYDGYPMCFPTPYFYPFFY